jgi:excisionase family DNA binding protein
MENDMITIKEAMRLYGISESTIRRWIKSGKVTSQVVTNQYMISQSDIEKILKTSKKKVSQVSTDSDMVNRLEREIEFLKEKIETLEKDKEFLQGQVQNLINTINILTTKQLPPPGQGLFTRLKNLFRK